MRCFTKKIYLILMLFMMMSLVFIDIFNNVVASVRPENKGKTSINDKGGSPQNSYDSQVNEAFELFKQGKYQDALNKALQATQLNNDRYDAYYVAGLTLYKLDSLDAATESFKKALDKAPEDTKQKVKEAIKAVDDKKIYLEHIRAGDQAFKDSLFAKAAQEYSLAWEIIPMREDIGVKAAQLWIKRQEYLKSAKILNYLISHTNDKTIAEKARSMLADIKDDVERVFKQKTEEVEGNIKRQELDNALKVSGELTMTMPDRYEPYLYLARIYAIQGKTDDVKKSLIEASKRNITAEAILIQEEFFAIFRYVEIRNLIYDVFGSTVARNAENISLVYRNLVRAEKLIKDQDFDDAKKELDIAETFFQRIDQNYQKLFPFKDVISAKRKFIKESEEKAKIDELRNDISGHWKRGKDILFVYEDEDTSEVTAYYKEVSAATKSRFSVEVDDLKFIGKRTGDTIKGVIVYFLDKEDSSLKEKIEKCNPSSLSVESEAVLKLSEDGKQLFEEGENKTIKLEYDWYNTLNCSWVIDRYTPVNRSTWYRMN